MANQPILLTPQEWDWGKVGHSHWDAKYAARLEATVDAQAKAVAALMASYTSGDEHCPVCRWRVGPPGHSEDCVLKPLEDAGWIAQGPPPNRPK